MREAKEILLTKLHQSGSKESKFVPAITLFASFFTHTHIYIHANLLHRKAFERANKRTRRVCRKICKSQTLYWTIIILVFLNTITLASEHYKQPTWLDSFQGIFVISSCTFLCCTIYNVQFTMYILHCFIYILQMTPCWSCRICQYFLCGSLHFGNVLKNVLPWISRVLCFTLQSIRHFCCYWFYKRDISHKIRRNAATWCLGASLCSFTSNFQSDTVSLP